MRQGCLYESQMAESMYGGMRFASGKHGAWTTG